jgi:hypothetical protein
VKQDKSLQLDMEEQFIDKGLCDFFIQTSSNKLKKGKVR